MNNINADIVIRNARKYHGQGRCVKDITEAIENKSWWYKNCVTQRKRGSKCCNSCPIRKLIENGEKVGETHGKKKTKTAD